MLKLHPGVVRALERSKYSHIFAACAAGHNDEISELLEPTRIASDTLVFSDVTVDSNGVIRQAATGDLVAANGGCKCGSASNAAPVAIGSLPTYDSVVTVCAMWAYGVWHFPAESLPALMGADGGLIDIPDGTRLHLPSKSVYETQWLRVIGVPEKVIANSITGHVKAARLDAPPMGACGAPSTRQARWLAGRVRAAVATPPPPRDTLILVQRTKHRVLPNHDEVLGAAQKAADAAGWSLKVFSDTTEHPPVADQLRLFARAAAVVAPHGGAGINSLACAPGTLYIEFLPTDTSINLCYAALASKLQLRYVGLPVNCDVSIISSELREYTIE